MGKIRSNPAIGSSWKEIRAEIFTPEEMAENDLKVAIIGEIIKVRQEKRITQKELEELSGVRQPIIARMERNNTNPQLGTILKILLSLGKTLAVVPLPKNNIKKGGKKKEGNKARTAMYSGSAACSKNNGYTFAACSRNR